MGWGVGRPEIGQFTWNLPYTYFSGTESSFTVVNHVPVPMEHATTNFKVMKQATTGLARNSSFTFLFGITATTRKRRQ